MNNPAPNLFNVPRDPQPGASPTVSIPCISLWRPWCDWVALGWKTIETRLHTRFAGLKGKRIAIHAAQKFDLDAHEAARPFMYDHKLAATKDFPDSSGLVVCTAMVEDVRWLTISDSSRACIECETPRFGLILGQIRVLPRTLKVKGRQGQFTVELPTSWVE